MKHERLRSEIAWQQLGLLEEWIYDSTPVGNQNIKDTAGQKDAFGFVADTAYLLDPPRFLQFFDAEWKIKKVGAPTGTLTAKAYDRTSGVAYLTLGQIDVSTVGAGYGSINIHFGREWDKIIVHGDSIIGIEFVDTSVDHAANYVVIKSDGAGSGSSGVEKLLRTHGTVTWDAADQKMWFYIEGIDALRYKYDPLLAWRETELI